MSNSHLQGLPDHYVLTIGRSFGSGGRELGRRLADRLGIAYYDKELLSEAAAAAGLDENIFKKNDERAPGFLSGLLPLNMGYSAGAWYTGPNAVGCDNIYRVQADFIRELAGRRPCVIVGRTADYVLRDDPMAINIFLHAPEEACIKRITGRGDCTREAEARQILRKTNKLRAEFYNFYTDKVWGSASSYDLTIDSSRLPMEEIVELVVSYLISRANQLNK